MIEIIPAIDLIDGKVVRLCQGDYAAKTIYSSSPVETAKSFVDAGFSRVHVVDLDGAKASKPLNLKALESIAALSGIRVEWGGGIKSAEALHQVFSAGASYAIVGSVAALKPELFCEWLDVYGADKMIFGADLFNGQIKISGWQEGSSTKLETLLELFAGHGLTRTICTDISKDGMMQGPAFDMYIQLQEQWPTIDFTVSGGISSLTDIQRLNEMGLRSVIVGKALYEGAVTLKQLQKFNV